MIVDINTNDVQNNFELIEKGWYQCQVTKEEMKPTATGGKQDVMEFTIIEDGKYANRKLWSRFNLVCPGSQQAEKIARDEIARLGAACGIVNLHDTAELVGKMCMVNVGIDDKTGDEPRNIVKGFKKCETFIPAPAGSPSTSPATAKAPWDR